MTFREIIQQMVEKEFEDVDYSKVQEVRHGRWVQDGTGYHAKCSVCGELIYRGWYYSFCPNCGAKMDEVNE